MLDEIKKRFADSSYSQLRRVRVVVEQDRIVLKGRVTSFYLKQKATHTVGQTDVRLDNQLEVVSPF